MVGRYRLGVRQRSPKCLMCFRRFICGEGHLRLTFGQLVRKSTLFFLKPRDPKLVYLHELLIRFNQLSVQISARYMPGRHISGPGDQRRKADSSAQLRQWR